MKKSEAVREIENMGYGYFYDQLGDLAVEEIFGTVQEDIQKSQLTGSGQWERWQEAFRITLTECTEAELNKIVPSFGLDPGEIDSSHDFLDMTYQLISKTIKKRGQSWEQ
jgi:hypothetical protein